MHVAALGISQEDLKMQLQNLEGQLEAAENTPGEEGLSRVRYYTQKIKDVKEQLKKAGVLAENDSRNVFWQHHLAHDKKRLKHKIHSNDKEQRLLARLEQIDHRIKVIHDAITDPAADLGPLKEELGSLLDEQKITREKLEQVQEEGIPSWGQKAPSSEEKDTEESDRENKSPYYVEKIQEELQRIYDAIYDAHLKTLKAKGGQELVTLGQTIAKLEQKEIELKRRLKKMGVKPNPPEILSNPAAYRERKSIKTEEEYIVELKHHLAVIEERRRTLNAKVKTASSGHELATLGSHLSQLEQQRLLLQKTITENKPPLQQAIDYNEETKHLLKAFPQTIPWGQATKEVMENFQNNPEAYTFKAVPKESLGWGQLSKDVREEMGISDTEHTALLQKMVEKETSGKGWGGLPLPAASSRQLPSKQGLWEEVQPAIAIDQGGYYDRPQPSFDGGYNAMQRVAMTNLWNDSATSPTPNMTLTDKAVTLWSA